MTETTDRRTVDVPYDPDAVLGEWGWLWMGENEEDGAWILVVTSEDDDGTLRVSGWNVDDAYSDVTPAYEAESWRHAPYIPLAAPACEPGAGALVTVRLPGGGAIAHTWNRPGEDADASIEAVLAAVMP